MGHLHHFIGTRKPSDLDEGSALWRPDAERFHSTGCGIQRRSHLPQGFACRSFVEVHKQRCLIAGVTKEIFAGWKGQRADPDGALGNEEERPATPTVGVARKHCRSEFLGDVVRSLPAGVAAALETQRKLSRKAGEVFSGLDRRGQR